MPARQSSLAAGGAARQRLRQRALAMAAGGMDDDARGLVDDDEVLVLVGDGEGRDGRVGGRRLARLRRVVDGHLLAAGDAVVLLDGLAVDQHAPGDDEPLRARARAERVGEQDVEPLAGGLSRDVPLDRHVRSPPGG